MQKTIKVDLIREGEGNLRTADKENPDFLRLMDSIAKNGLLDPIAVEVYQETHPENPEEIVFDGYRIVNGLQRLTAFIELGLEEIPCNVVTITDENDRTVKQIVANLQTIPTKPHEYAKAVKQLMNANPTATLSEIAGMISANEDFIRKRLSLLNLSDEAGNLVDEGEIKLHQAHCLALLPEAEQAEWMEQARTQDANAFAGSVETRVKEIRQERMAAIRGQESTFEPKAHLRKISEIQEERANAQEIRTLLSANNVTDPLEAVRIALDWILHLDEPTVSAAKEDYEVKRKQREEQRRRKKEGNLQAKRDKHLEEAKKLAEEIAKEEAAKAEATA